MAEQTPVLPDDPKPEINHPDVKTLPEMAALFVKTIGEFHSLKATVGSVPQELTNNLNQMQQQLDRLEVAQKGRGPLGGPSLEHRGPVDPNVKAKTEALEVFLRKGEKGLFSGQFQALEPHAKANIVGDDSKGGYLCPPDWAAEILKEVVEITPMRELASSQRFVGKEVWFPKRKSLPTAYFPGEAPPTDTADSNSDYGLVKISAEIMRSVIIISEEALEDPAYDLRQQIVADAGLAFAVAENRNFLLGTGDRAPTGLVTAVSKVAARITKSGATTKITGPGLISAFYEPKGTYSSKGAWLMNRRTIREVRLLVDEEGRPIWGYNLAGLLTAAQPTINDRPYFEAPDLPAPNSAGVFTTGDIPIVFGDFQRGYRIGDRRDVWINEDDKTMAARGLRRFIVSKRVAGDAIMDEAFQLVQIGT